jgi:hypothetical protein
MRGEGSARVWTEKGLDSRSAYAHQHYLAPKHPVDGMDKRCSCGSGWVYWDGISEARGYAHVRVAWW